MDDVDTAASHIYCRGCGETFELNSVQFPCPSCSGILDVRYDFEKLMVDRDEIEERNGSLWKYRELLPIQSEEHIVSLGEGDTPLIDAPRLADKLGVSRVLIKDEGQNPTNTFKDRGASLSISAAKEQGIHSIGIPSAGNAGQSAAAYAARAGMDCHVFLPSQSGEIQQTLVKLHGAHLHLVDGNLSDAGKAFADARDGNGLYSVATFQTPFRLEGKKAMGYEIFEQGGWVGPDEIFYPTGGGVGLVGIWKAYQELREIGWLETQTPPKLNVVQSTGCAPVVEAIINGYPRHQVWEDPKSIGRGIEVPDPGASDWIIEAVNASDGTGVTVSDEAALEGAKLAASQAGVEMCVEPGAALAGAVQMAEEGRLDKDSEILIVNTGAGNKASTDLATVLKD